MDGYFLVGFATGLRTMTPVTVFCWFAYLGLLPETGWATWSGKLVSVVVFTVLALGEYYGDTRPETPSRTTPLPLMARIVFGALAGALSAHGNTFPVAGGVIFGAVGAVAGAYVGRYVRVWAAKRLGRDLPVALTESLLAIAITLYVAWANHGFYLLQQQGG